VSYGIDFPALALLAVVILNNADDVFAVMIEATPWINTCFLREEEEHLRS
jgi:hypothetical protein